MMGRSMSSRALAAVVGTTALLAASLGSLPAATASVVPAGQVVAQQAAADITELRAGEELRAGSALVSPSGRYRLALDAQGFVTLLERANWLAGRTEHFLPLDQEGGADRLVLQTDGNLVAYTSTGRVVLSADTWDLGAVALRLQDDRELVLVDASGSTVVDFGTGSYDVVESGTALLPGDVVDGEADRTRLLMQGDGNLVLYRGGTAMWSSRTASNPGAGAVMQADGNLVVYSSAATGRRALFSTRTARPTDNRFPLLRVEDTEVSVLRAFEHGSYEAVWGSNWSKSRVESGDELHPGDRRRSADSRCTLVMQTDRNLVEYCDGRAVFSTGRPAERFAIDATLPEARMQTDGNMVVYGIPYLEGAGPLVFFATRTNARGSSLLVQNDRNVVVYAPDGRPTWSARTGRIR